MILSELWKVLCVIGMIAGIGICALCILMCVLIGVMVIHACVSDDRQVEEEGVNKNNDGAQSGEKSEESWSDGEENNAEEKVWLVRTPDGTWVKTAGKPMYMKVGEDEGIDEVR